MNGPSHHPSDALLLAYAGGGLGEAPATVVATHLAYCALCRALAALADAVGGALLERLAPEAMADDGLARALARLDDLPAPDILRPRPPAGPWPEPLSSMLAGGGPTVWRWLGPGLGQAPVGSLKSLRLLQARPGAVVPPHGHRGLELTLVLRGAFDDGSSRYAVGDLLEADDDTVHDQRAAPGEDCLCLVAIERPLRFRRLIHRLTQPIVGI